MATTLTARAPEPARPTTDRGLWLLLLAGWVVPVLLAAVQTVTRGIVGEGQEIGWWAAVARQLPFWTPLAVLSPVLFAYARRFPFDRRRPLRSSAQILVTLLVAGFLLLAASALLAVPLEGRAFTYSNVANTTGAMLIRSYHFYLFMVGAALAVGHALENHRRARDRALAASRLSGQLAEARMAGLAAQLQPHFLFNTLHSISSLVDEDPAMAQEMITALGDLLRHRLDGSTEPLTSLAEELATLDLYLAIEKIRFSDRLRVHRDIASEALEIVVPSLVLQPLVENAIRHGIASREGAGELRIAARAEGDRLVLEVEDDGAGLERWERAGRPRGLGLVNTEERLRELYGTGGRLALEPRDPHGTRVRVTLPTATPRPGEERP